MNQSTAQFLRVGGQNLEDDNEPSYYEKQQQAFIFILDFNSLSGNYRALALTATERFMRAICLSPTKHFVSVLVCGVAGCGNDNIKVLVDLNVPSTEDIDRVRDPGELVAHPDSFVVEDALRVASSFETSAMRQVFLVTANDDPTRGDENAARQMRRRVLDYSESMNIEILGMPETFDGSKLYAELVKAMGFTDGLHLCSTVDDLLETIKLIRHRKSRTYAQLRLELSPGMVPLAVNLYTTISQSRPQTAKELAEADNSLLTRRREYIVYEDQEENRLPRPPTSESTRVGADTPVIPPTGGGAGTPAIPPGARRLIKEEIRMAQEWGGEQIVLDHDEVSELRRFVDLEKQPSVRLVGFKPLSHLHRKCHFQVRAPLFMTADESRCLGSACAFRALHESCLKQQKYALVNLVTRSNSAPRLAALCPQEEVKDANGSVKQSRGFHVIFLPYADELRPMKDVYGDDVVKPSQRLNDAPKRGTITDATKSFAKKADMPWKPADFENPQIQSQNRILEALALDEEDAVAYHDLTRPFDENCTEESHLHHASRWQLLSSELQQFSEAVGHSLKRPGEASSGSSAAKRPRVDFDIGTEARAGRLGRHTVAVLKEAAANAGISLSGVSRKADIIACVAKHFQC